MTHKWGKCNLAKEKWYLSAWFEGVFCKCPQHVYHCPHAYNIHYGIWFSYSLWVVCDHNDFGRESHDGLKRVGDPYVIYGVRLRVIESTIMIGWRTEINKDDKSSWPNQCSSRWWVSSVPMWWYRKVGYPSKWEVGLIAWRRTTMWEVSQMVANKECQRENVDRVGS